MMSYLDFVDEQAVEVLRMLCSYLVRWGGIGAVGAGLICILSGREHVGKEGNTWVTMGLGQSQLKCTRTKK
jgi:hypothetical protein